MNLRAFLNDLPRGGVTEFAGRVNISPIYLSQLAAGQDKRVPSPELCVVLEAATDRRVVRWDLRPSDWWLIWPELIGVDGAPAIPSQKSEPAAAGV